MYQYSVVEFPANDPGRVSAELGDFADQGWRVKATWTFMARDTFPGHRADVAPTKVEKLAVILER